MADLSLDPLHRFSDRVQDYVRFRPSYPPELIAHLRHQAGLGPGCMVADVGAGTGIFTRLLLETGARVFAVEPNDAMRAAAEVELARNPRFTSVPGTSEQTGLPDRSVGLITCAQAFHWFEPMATRREFRRIGSTGAWCALVWNEPIADATEFSQGYERIKENYGTDFEAVRHRSTERKDIYDRFFGRRTWEKRSFGNFQVLDFEGLKGRLLSSSYAPKEGHPSHPPMLAALRELYERCQQGDMIRMDYRTNLYLGQFSD